ncbi:protein kinase [Nonomuraea phyllanthi]|uniref:non-specific serine/threonine protein kinase n=1 Tax=Nonomuraea phyllanthi TaxID=2219224 RepID=A0A5C4W990_9ACTN|nr:serine/threonine-protein kinase [Nonomuraea phyllanthi]KAB8192287.1 protein kinase [Nonomuraea phyllanthi]
MAADHLLGGPGPDGGPDGGPGGGPPSAQSQGRLVGQRYRLMSPVGRGGMGMVWHAHDVLLDRDVAVKELILPYGLDHAGMQGAHRRMLREARSAARLTHPGIVTVHDVVEEDGRPWIVMELVRAWSLEQAVRQSGPLPVLQAAEIGIRVLDALRHAHAAGILHRDIKPGNVLLTSDRVVLTDFGIAAIEGDVTITQTGLLMGSPAYIPPERLSGQPITQAADLWSFGATLYAAVEGRPPYEGPDPVAVLGSVLTQEPIAPQRAGSLQPVIEGLLRKNPALRLTSDQAVEMLEAVLRAHGSARPRPVEALPAQDDPPPLDPGPMPSRIVETPSGPIRVPYDPMTSPSGGYSMPYDGLSSPSGSHETASLRAPAGGFDAFRSSSGPQPAGEPPAAAHPSGPPYRIGAGASRPEGAGADADLSRARRIGADLDDDSGPRPQPILPLTTDSRTSSGATPWPPASSDDLREQSRDIGRSRLATLPSAAPRQGRRRPGEDDGGRSRRPAVLAIIGALVAAVVVVGVAVMILTSGEPVTPTPLAATSPTTSTPGGDPSPAPAGYTEHEAAGFAVAVPEGWKETTSGGATTFSGPKDSGIRITVREAAPQTDGGLAALGKKEAAGGVEGYIQVRLQKVGYRGWRAADWEYTYTTSAGVPMHAQTRYVTVGDGAAYTIAFDLPELTWDEQAEARKVFLDTFQPTGP